MAALREKLLKSKMYRIILLVILFSMSGGTLLFSPFFKKSTTNPLVMMTVNGKEVSRKTYELRLAQEYEYIAMLKQRYGQFAESLLQMMGLNNPKETALKTLINQELLNQVAQKLGIDFSTEFIMNRLSDPSFVVNALRDAIPLQTLNPNGSINSSALSSWLKQRGMTMNDFEHSVEEALSRQLVNDLVATTIFIAPQEAERYFVNNFLKRKYSFLEVPVETYIQAARKKEVADKDLKSFFDAENKATKRYWVPEERNVTYWTFAPQDFGVIVGAEEIERYYAKNKSEKFIENPVQIKLKHIFFKVEEGVTPALIEKKAREVKEQLDKNPSLFDKLAQEHSDDKETAKKGGLLGFVKRGDNDPALWRAALRLQKDNEISNLIATDNGIEILQRLERKAATYKPLESVKKDIEKTLLQQSFKKKFVQESERALEALADEKGAVESFVSLKKGKKEQKSAVRLSDSKVAQKAFKTKKGGWGVTFDDAGNGALINVEEVVKAHEPAFASVKESIKEDFYTKKGLEGMKEAVAGLEKELKDKKTLNDLAKSRGLKVETTDWIKKDNKEVLEKLEKQGVPLRELFFVSDKEGSVSRAETPKAGYVAQLETVEPFDWVLFKDKKSEVLKDLYKEKKELHIRGFIDSLYKDATINHMQESRGTSQLPLDDIF